MSNDNRLQPFHFKRKDRFDKNVRPTRLAKIKKIIVYMNICVISLCAIIFYRLIDLGISNTRQSNLDNQLLEKYELPSLKITRPDILDRNQSVLATNLQVTSLQIDTKKIIDVEDAVKKLEQALPDLSLIHI